MSITITLDTNAINTLDLSPIEAKIADLPLDKGIAQNLSRYEQQLQFVINYDRQADDPRELSEIPEIRLWFICLDAAYPWLPFFLDWRSGELARYTAMLVPHQFSRSEGIIYNPEALEIYVMQKIFVLSTWCKHQELAATSRLKSFAQLFGYDIDESFFNQII